ncbi:Crp/Fnr family transcriptional regulator [Massilia genomosp. 1]|uniref:Cyclic nucleotide-binding domain-containing protein n=1 Tax=Massilia genomosp. 1 TaxID=2609280 RepID=A0ABX0MYN6_9BURK|nr:Crp/Fnr family transcriptional regulator [Massilia genomosp. 1]NHZ65346.1 cyclic nucleotide-binding domain-containing protein [Massilia genomosp. 1]
MEKTRFAPQTFLARLPLFDAMSPEELEAIAAGTSERHAGRGEIIFQRGDACRGFHLLIFGQVKLAAGVANGAEKIIELIGPGHSFGEALMFMEKPYIVSATALADSLLLHVSKEAVFDGIAHDPGFARKMLAGLSRRMHGLICDLESVALQSGTQRVIGYLLQDEATGQGAQLTLPVSKAVVASRLNLTPEHFSRILADLSVHGLIGVQGRNVTIMHIDGLRGYAG